LDSAHPDVFVLLLDFRVLYHIVGTRTSRYTGRRATSSLLQTSFRPDLDVLHG